MIKKLKIAAVIVILLSGAGVFLYFKYFFTYEQKNVLKRNIESITGQNLKISILSYDGKVIKQWENVQKITSGKDERNYTYFYTKDNKYVQIPDSVLYIAEEE